MSTELPKRNIFSKIGVFASKSVSSVGVVAKAFYTIYKYDMADEPNRPENTQHVQRVCRDLCKVFNVHVKVHGELPTQPALWVSNHVSWLDIPVLGAAARVFFLSKAEIKDWPIIGKIAQGGGTLFIKRGSGDSSRIREQISTFLQQDCPVLFFPEATTGDGKQIRKIYGKLLGAAISAKRPVNPVVVCYVNANGELDSIVPFVDDTFVENVLKVIQMQQVTAHVKVLPQIDVEGHTLESLTDAVRESMVNGLADLQKEVLTSQSSQSNLS